jgi:hypothetical protein
LEPGECRAPLAYMLSTDCTPGPPYGYLCEALEDGGKKPWKLLTLAPLLQIYGAVPQVTLTLRVWLASVHSFIVPLMPSAPGSSPSPTMHPLRQTAKPFGVVVR